MKEIKVGLYFTPEKKKFAYLEKNADLAASKMTAELYLGFLQSPSNAEGFSLPLKEDVDSFMKQPGNETADVVLKKLDEQYQKYKFLELNLAQKKRR